MPGSPSAVLVRCGWRRRLILHEAQKRSTENSQVATAFFGFRCDVAPTQGSQHLGRAPADGGLRVGVLLGRITRGRRDILRVQFGEPVWLPVRGGPRHLLYQRLLRDEVGQHLRWQQRRRQHAATHVLRSAEEANHVLRSAAAAHVLRSAEEADHVLRSAAAAHDLHPTAAQKNSLRPTAAAAHDLRTPSPHGVRSTAAQKNSLRSAATAAHRIHPAAAAAHGLRSPPPPDALQCANRGADTRAYPMSRGQVLQHCMPR